MDWEKYQKDFLWFSYFGITENDVKSGKVDKKRAISICAGRAYLDLSRTLKFSFSTTELKDLKKENNEFYTSYLNAKEDFKTKIEKELTDRIHCFFDNNCDYREWHKNTVDEIIRIAKDKKVNSEKLFLEFYVGQAQKWVNMTLKNMMVMGLWDSEIDKIITCLDIPLDTYILSAAKKEKGEKVFEDMEVEGLGIPKEIALWSQINDYKQYVEYQNEIKKETENKQIEWEADAWIAQATRENSKT